MKINKRSLSALLWAGILILILAACTSPQLDTAAEVDTQNGDLAIEVEPTKEPVTENNNSNAIGFPR